MSFKKCFVHATKKMASTNKTLEMLYDYDDEFMLSTNSAVKSRPLDKKRHIFLIWK
jgi:hypothetical protein